MQRRDFVKLAGVAALVPSPVFAGGRDVLFALEESGGESPRLRGRVVLFAWDIFLGAGLWRSLARRGDRVCLAGIEDPETIEWGLSESVWHEGAELPWDLGETLFFAHNLNGLLLPLDSRDLTKRFEAQARVHLDRAREIGLPERYRLVVSGKLVHHGWHGCVLGTSPIFVDGDVEGGGGTFDSVGDFALEVERRTMDQHEGTP